jgi:hypothetical protein
LASVPAHHPQNSGYTPLDLLDLLCFIFQRVMLMIERIFLGKFGGEAALSFDIRRQLLQVKPLLQNIAQMLLGIPKLANSVWCASR